MLPPHPTRGAPPSHGSDAHAVHAGALRDVEKLGSAPVATHWSHVRSVVAVPLRRTASPGSQSDCGRHDERPGLG